MPKNWSQDALIKLLKSKSCSTNDIGRLIRRPEVYINSPDVDFITPFNHAVRNENCSTEVIKYLLDNGADLTRGDFGGTPLHHLVKKLHKNAINVACLLLDYGTQVDEVDENGATALHHAVQTQGYKDIVKLLLDRGANLDAKCEKFRRTALHYAVDVKGGDFDIIKLLLDRGANVHDRCKDFRQPLHYAALYCHPRIIKLLLNRGAKVNATDCGNTSALYQCVSLKNRAVTKVMLKYGALVNCGTPHPLHIAIPFYNRGTYDIDCLEQIRLLLQYALLENAVLNMEDYYTSSGLPTELADYRTKCLREIDAMQLVSINKSTLLQYIFQLRQEMPRKQKDDIKPILNTLLRQISTNAFPIYNEVMFGLIKRDYLEDFLENREFHAKSDDPSASKNPVLPSCVLVHLTRYLPKVDFLNFVLTFCNFQGRGDDSRPKQQKRWLSADEGPTFSEIKEQLKNYWKKFKF